MLVIKCFARDERDHSEKIQSVCIIETFSMLLFESVKQSSGPVKQSVSNRSAAASRRLFRKAMRSAPSLQQEQVAPLQVSSVLIQFALNVATAAVAPPLVQPVPVQFFISRSRIAREYKF